jgi:Xaa-Pro aminopeptidase
VNHLDEKIQQIQEVLRRADLPGWLFYDFRGSDPIAYRILGLDTHGHFSRRWFYLIPAQGKPRKLVNRIESHNLDPLPGETTQYTAWEELQGNLEEMLEGLDSVAMQYSPGNAIPYVSLVDAGTVEFIRSLGLKLESSADLIQRFECVWNDQEIAEHREAAAKITQIVHEAFKFTAAQIAETGKTNEYKVQSFIMEQFDEEGLETDFPPIVAVNEHSGDPHYAPSEESFWEIRKGDFLLIDLWARVKDRDAVFADITWTAYFGDAIPERIKEVFKVVSTARDTGVEFIREKLAQGTIPLGYEVDDAVRTVIQEAGLGEFILHRTGHNLARTIHGNGVNFDNFETHDTRRVIPGITCTVEPGVYQSDFGLRSEINIYITSTGVEITTPPQEAVLLFEC